MLFLDLKNKLAQMQRTQPLRPGLKETCWIPIHNIDIITKVDPPSYGSTGDFTALITALTVRR